MMNATKKQYISPLMEQTKCCLLSIIALSVNGNKTADPNNDWESKGRSRQSHMLTDEDEDFLLEIISHSDNEKTNSLW